MKTNRDIENAVGARVFCAMNISSDDGLSAEWEFENCVKAVLPDTSDIPDITYGALLPATHLLGG